MNNDKFQELPGDHAGKTSHQSSQPSCDPFDEIYHTAEHPAQRRKDDETNRLQETQDDLAVEELRSQAFEETAAREDN